MNVKLETIPEEKLSQQQRVHLQFARHIVGKVPIFPAHIHNGVPIIGAYKLQTGEIFITPQRLDRLRYTMNTTIHELAHHQSGADDGTRAHDNAIKRLGAQVMAEAENDKYLSETLARCVW